MNERDRQNSSERSHQQGGGYRGNQSYDSPRQASQWQSEDDRQQGGNWQQDSGWRGNDEEAAREYRFSGQSNASYDAGYQSRDDDQRGSSRGYDSSYREQGHRQQAYGRQDYGQQGHPSRDRDWQDRSYSPRGQGGSSSGYGPQNSERQGYGQQGYGQQRGTPYAGRNFDASGGNDFGSFTSEDFGGRDFSNRGGGAVGGMRPSESYKPTYSASRLFDHDDDRGGQRGHGNGGDDRGFFQRAGDEVASWFGDQDASRRREQDHRGRGPAGYTRSDERIREDANDHLTHDWGVDASNITVSVSSGEITLDGTVDSRQAKRRAEDCVEHISGVKHVQNNLRVQERSSSYGGSGSSSSASSYGGQGQSGSSFGSTGTGGQSASTSDTTGTTASGSVASGASSLGSSTPSSAAASSSTGGANTTGGIGSTATGSVGTASSPRASDKTS